MPLITTKEACALVDRSAITLRNWRAGYRWEDGKKKYFFDDQSVLPHTYNKELNCIMYDMEDVISWRNRIQSKRKKSLS